MTTTLPLRPLLLALALLLVPQAALARLQVAATVTPLAALARDIGGDLVQVHALSAPTQDPHFVDPRPSLILLLNKADLLLVNGVELEAGWLPPLQRTARNPAILQGARGHFDASQHVPLRDVPTAPIDRSHGDVHPGGNPHFWSDARAAARVARALAARLAQLDPPNAATYTQRADALCKRLEAFAATQKARFAALSPDRRRVVTYHASLGYLLDALGLEQVATLEPKPGVSPSPAHVSRVVAAIRERAVRALLQEEYYPRSTTQTVARLSGARLVTLPGGPDFDRGETYEAWLTRLTNGIHDALAQ